MKHQALRGLRILLSLVVFAAVGGPGGGGLDLFVQQIRAIGARQWLGLMAGSMVPGALAVTPLIERITHSQRRPSDQAAARETGFTA